MPRLLGVDIPREKRIDASLPYIYGLGRVTAKKVLDLVQAQALKVRAKRTAK